MMITQGQATLFHSEVNSFIGLALVASVAAWFGLMIWQSAFNQNPVADALSKALYEKQQISQQL